jgi:hypothetical protein
MFFGDDWSNIRHYREFEIAPTGDWIDLAIDLDRRSFDAEWRSGWKTAARIDKSLVRGLSDSSQVDYGQEDRARHAMACELVPHRRRGARRATPFPVLAADLRSRSRPKPRARALRHAGLCGVASASTTLLVSQFDVFELEHPLQVVGLRHEE